MWAPVWPHACILGQTEIYVEESLRCGGGALWVSLFKHTKQQEEEEEEEEVQQDALHVGPVWELTHPAPAIHLRGQTSSGRAAPREKESPHTSVHPPAAAPRDPPVRNGALLPGTRGRVAGNFLDPSRIGELWRKKRLRYL